MTEKTGTTELLTPANGTHTRPRKPKRLPLRSFFMALLVTYALGVTLGLTLFR